MSFFIVIDGGTTNLRVTLTNGSADILDVVKRSVGAAASAVSGSSRGLRDAVRECIEELLARNGLRADEVERCIAYGMITSAGGLVEIPHLCAPVTVQMLRAGMVRMDFRDISPFPIEFIPGVRNFSGEVTLENLAGMDMMRGEETEAVGLYRLLQPERSCVLVLPGSHTKFVAMTPDGSISGCMTTMSGELLASLTKHTILSESVEGQFVSAEEYDREMFLAGAEACRAGLGRAAFSVRILKTLGGLPRAKAASFLLGTVLSADLDALNAFKSADGQSMICVAGKEPLRTALCDLLTTAGKRAVGADEGVTARMGVLGALIIAGYI